MPKFWTKNDHVRILELCGVFLGHLPSEGTTLLTTGQTYITSRVSSKLIDGLYDLLATTLIDKQKADMALCRIRDEIANDKDNQPG